MRFSRQEYWNGLSFPSPGDLPNPGIEPRSPVLQADSLPAELSGKPLFLEGVFFNPVLGVLDGEGNGTPLQYSCLENPMDGGAW